MLFIGGGFSALLTAARLRERGVESIRIVERGADVGGTWYWNRYPGAACDVPAYDYLPLLDEMEYVPSRLYAKGPEIYAHCRPVNDSERQHFLDMLDHKGQTKLELAVEVAGREGPAVSFKGSYVVLPPNKFPV